VGIFGGIRHTTNREKRLRKIIVGTSCFRNKKKKKEKMKRLKLVGTPVEKTP